VTVALPWLLVLALAAPEKGSLLSDPVAMEHFEAAQRAFNEGDYDAASKELERAFLIEPADALLYPWAQAERFSGRCKVAIDLYRRFLETDPSPNFRVAAEENLARCRAEVEEAGEDSGGEPDPLEEDPLDDGWDAVAATEEDRPETAKPDDRSKAAWIRDPLGGVLSGLGVAGVATGAALMAVSLSRAGRVAEEDTNQGYLDARKSATNLRNAGAIALGVGGALLIGGIVRYVVVAKRSKRRTTASAWMDGRSATVVVQTRF
jgi:tetratricopeptide (TPR) repeat protein